MQAIERNEGMINWFEAWPLSLCPSPGEQLHILINWSQTNERKPIIIPRLFLLSNLSFLADWEEQSSRASRPLSSLRPHLEPDHLPRSEVLASSSHSWCWAGNKDPQCNGLYVVIIIIFRNTYYYNKSMSSPSLSPSIMIKSVHGQNFAVRFWPLRYLIVPRCIHPDNIMQVNSIDMMFCHHHYLTIMN